MGCEIFAKGVGYFRAGRHSHIGVNTLPFNIVRIANHSGFGDGVVGDERAFHFGRAHAVAGDINHIVDPARNPVKSVGVAFTAIAGKVTARIGGKVSLDKALMIAVNRAHLARP